MNKKWLLLAGDKPVQGDEQIIETLLKNRGFQNHQETEAFLNPPNPNTLTAKDLDIDEKALKKAVNRIRAAIKEGEKIIIYGDYDTDGVCATAIVWETLYRLGAKVLPFIPSREDGYGLKKEKIEELKAEGCRLIITVDHGIVANEPIEEAAKLGVEVIVTDHHLAGEKKPKAYALIHTLKLSGAGVAWFLAAQFAQPGLELATIGTIADMMPLTGANRSLVKYGLAELRKTNRKGLLALCEVAGIKPTEIGTYEIGYILAPRLNAAGRIDNAMDALRLICTNNTDQALVWARKINEQNKQRQQLTLQMTLHARETWLSAEQGKMIFVSHESYEEGIVGLVAGKLTEEFYRPTVVVAKGEQYCRASARSVNGFNIVEAIRACGDLLGSHGGHALAAGFTVETGKLEMLKERLLAIAEQQITEEHLTPVLKIDMEIEGKDINLELWEAIKQLEPFGYGNPEPVFLTRNLKLFDYRLVGDEGRHLKMKLVVPGEKKIVEAIGFNLGRLAASLTPSGEVEVVYSLGLDSWDGRQKVQLKVKDLKVIHGD